MQLNMHLQHMNDYLPENAAIILLDLAENYSFIVQDAIQSFHWNNLQATIHPIVKPGL